MLMVYSSLLPGFFINIILPTQTRMLALWSPPPTTNLPLIMVPRP